MQADDPLACVVLGTGRVLEHMDLLRHSTPWPFDTNRLDEEQAIIAWPILKEYEKLITRPCMTFDPFSGAATTGLVARELGRHYIGLELSGEYLQQSRERLSLDALDAWKGNGKAKETDLSDLPMFRGA